MLLLNVLQITMSRYHMDTNISGSTVGSVGPGGQVTITNISSSRSSHHDNVKLVSELGHLVTKKKTNLVKSKIMKGKTHF